MAHIIEQFLISYSLSVKAAGTFLYKIMWPGTDTAAIM